MQISVIGTGYVGLIAGLGFADFGNDVICVDNNQHKLDMLRKCKCPIYEPGAEELLERNMEAGRINFSNDMQNAVEIADIIFITVGTPEDQNGDADLKYVYEVANQIGKYINKYTIIVDKSTVPVGTSREVRQIILNQLEKRGEEIEFDVASNPEFLREGKSVSDFMNPDRIVLGVTTERAEKQLVQLYSVFSRSNKPIIVTNPETAEMIKYASNAFLATKIMFINEMANLCEKVGANVLQVAYAMGRDRRISPLFLHPGPGYGGSCFPKDTKAIVKTAEKFGIDMTIIDSVIRANQKQKQLSAEKIRDHFPEGGIVGILGISFKPETDDIRESSAIEIIRMLSKYPNFTFRLYDPEAMELAQEALKDIDPNKLVWCAEAKSVAVGCDALAIITEWGEFRSLDFDELLINMNGRHIFDFRNIYQRADIEERGFKYFGTGV